MTTKKAYRIRDKRTGKYVALGYKPKSTWSKFPSQAIRYNKNVLQGDENFVVEVFDLVKTSELGLDGKDLLVVAAQLRPIHLDISTYNDSVSAYERDGRCYICVTDSDSHWGEKEISRRLFMELQTEFVR